LEKLKKIGKKLEKIEGQSKKNDKSRVRAYSHEKGVRAYSHEK
jgi:hypothetical protein